MKKGGGGGGTNYVKFYDNKHIEYILVDYFSSVLSVELIELEYLSNFLCALKIALINLDPAFSGYLSVVSLIKLPKDKKRSCFSFSVQDENKLHRGVCFLPK